ncbi:MAG: N-acetylneuraminic acid synthase [Desulforudis sp.]|jgi:N-acetylneuraminate synthase|nr:MAG: N-acetylneuraminic acid synthase [Desulforudis sp.]
MTVGDIKFIADIGANHNQSLDRARRLIAAAAEIGCWGVKFQLFKADRLWGDQETQNKMHERELPPEWLPKLARAAHASGLTFGCTPFDLEAVNRLTPHVDFFKIGSYELLWDDLILACAAREKPLILSTGMATNDEIKTALDLLPERIRHEKTFILHCLSRYPAKPEEANLWRIAYLQSAFRPVPAGWSDHTASIGVLCGAASLGARMIEVHLDLDDGQGREIGHGHCWPASELQRAIRAVKDFRAADKGPDRSCAPTDRDLAHLRTDPLTGRRPTVKP